MRNPSVPAMLALFYLLGSICELGSQNIPPLIGDQIGKPKITIPNPLSQQGRQKDGSNQSYIPSAPDAEVRGFLDAFVKGVADKDLAKIGACYSQQPGLLVYWNSQEMRGWEAVQTQWQKAFSEPAGVKLTLSEPEINVFGRFAWVTARYQKETQEESRPRSQMGHVTFVLEKKRAQWLILHEHASQDPSS